MLKKVAALLMAVLLVSLVAVPQQASAALPPKPTGITDVTGNAKGTISVVDPVGDYWRLLSQATDQWVWPDWSDSYTAAGEQVEVGFYDGGSKVVTVHDTGICEILIDQYAKTDGPHFDSDQAAKAYVYNPADFPNAVVFPDAQPGIQNGRILAPIRFLFENMGYKVDWDPQGVTITGKGHDIRLFYGEKRAIVDGQEKALDVAPFIWHDRTYLPLRFLFESVGAVVGWENGVKRAWIWTDPNDPSLAVARRDATLSITTDYVK